MARLQLNKSSLAREAAKLKTYRRFLPALDLKRQQLMAEQARARLALEELEDQCRHFSIIAGQMIPMMANRGIGLHGLVRLNGFSVEQENLVGTKLPVLAQVDITIAPYSPLSRPHWVDDVAQRLKDYLKLQVERDIAQARLKALDKAVETTTQRVNLFDKVLIPQTTRNIRKIRIYLSDSQMTAVVRAKMSKSKRAVS